MFCFYHKIRYEYETWADVCYHWTKTKTTARYPDNAQIPYWPYRYYYQQLPQAKSNDYRRMCYSDAWFVIQIILEKYNFHQISNVNRQQQKRSRIVMAAVPMIWWPKVRCHWIARICEIWWTWAASSCQRRRRAERYDRGSNWISHAQASRDRAEC